MPVRPHSLRALCSGRPQWASRHRWLSSNSPQTPAAKDGQHDKKFAETLNLPKTTFALRSDPAKLDTFRARSGRELYQWQWTSRSNDPLFILHDGPPYANGDLHMGHALNKILKDIINRYHVSLGHRVHYIPGWDCHGLPIENKVLKSLGKESHELSPGTIRSAADAYARQEVASQAKQFSELGIMADWDPRSTYRTLDPAYEIRQLRVFQKMVERGLIYRDFRPVHYSPSSRSALAEAELVYHDRHVSHSAYVTFELNLESPHMSPALLSLVSGRRNVRLMVWTTTPWTLTANMGIAVGSELDYTAVARGVDPAEPIYIFAKEREAALSQLVEQDEALTTIANIKGSDLAGATYHPLFHTLIPDAERAQTIAPLPIMTGSHVTSETGTGLVHCAPAHGAEDYALFKSRGLLHSAGSMGMLCHVDLEARFSANVKEVVGSEAAETLVGKDILGDGGKAIVDLVRQVGALSKVERYRHRYPYDWKTDKPIIVMPTSQWFANLDNIKDDAVNALQDVSFYPPQSRNRLESFVRSRSEWCISRQRVWGVPIPSLHHTPSGRTVLDAKSLDHIIKILKEKGTAHWWDGPVAEFVPPELYENMDAKEVESTWRKGTDTMDVWFDSGSSWSMLAEQFSDEKRRFYADVCLEGSDQHRGWFQSQLLTSAATSSSDDTNSRSASPYGTLITHGMVLDETGKKMSKSLGNIVSPMTIIHGGENKKKEPAYGTEVLRLWAGTVEFVKDMSIGPKVLSQCAEALRKIRNSARFMLGNMRDRRPEQRANRTEFGLAERYVMHELYKLEKTALEGYASFEFPRVVNALSNFANITLSSFYLDITKDCLYANALQSRDRRVIVTVFEKALDTMTHVMAPILPHLAEEIHDTLDVKGSDNSKAVSVFAKKWLPLGPEWQDLKAEADMNTLLSFRKEVLVLLERARRDKVLGSSLEADVNIIVTKAIADHPVVQLLQREANFLKSLFIVSDVALVEEDSSDTAAWCYIGEETLKEPDEKIAIVVQPAALHKCPRCWTFTRSEKEEVCQRCADVIKN